MIFLIIANQGRGRAIVSCPMTVATNWRMIAFAPHAAGANPTGAHMKTRFATFTLALATLAALPALAQESRPATPVPAPAATAPALPPAREADVATADAIVAALYDVISGKAGQARDWNRLRSLFIADGKLMAVGPRQTGGFGLRNMPVEEYIARAGKNFNELGFFEREVARSSDSYGQIVHLFSTYESRRAPEDAQPFQRGINSIQLYNDGARWWIVNVLWRAEDAKLPLPAHYLKSR